MDIMNLPKIINKYQVQSGSIHENLLFFLEVSETVYGGYNEKKVLNSHRDNVLFFSDLTERFNLSITMRPVQNGDQFVFFNLTNYLEQEQTIKFSLVLNNVAESEIYDLNKYYQEPDYSKRYGINKLTTPSKYVNSTKGSVFVSKCFFFSDNNILYNSHNKSITRKLYKEMDCTKVLEKNKATHIQTVIKLPPGKKMDMFFIISKEFLFSSNNNLNAFFEEYSSAIKNNDVRYNMWLTPQGSYTKLPYSIEPFDPDAYGINLHHMSKKEMFKYYRDSDDRFYYNMLYNAIIQLFGYRPNKNGVFLTDYTSTWLKKDYQLTAPYIDTRLNETISLTLEDNKSLFTFPELENYHLIYANYLVEYSKTGKLLDVGNGSYFFPDYFTSDQIAIPTHSSLNHQLGIVNYLIKSFEETKNVEYKVVFEGVLSAIEATKSEWVSENGDLYYKVAYVNGHLHFLEKDYVYVTLIDLLLVQDNFIKIYGNENKALRELIECKMIYLQKNNYGLNDETALLPQNEDVSSRLIARKLAVKLLYIN